RSSDLIRLKKYSPEVEQKIVVILKEQADVSMAGSIHGKDAKARFVFHKLLMTAEESQRELVELLNARSIDFRSFYIVNMVALKADLDLITELAALPYVKEVLEDSSFKLEDSPEEDRNDPGLRTVEWNITKIKAPEVWAMGHLGEGVVIGGQDTGYKWDHVALVNKYRGGTNDHDYNWHDAIHEIDSHNTGSNPCGLSIPAPCDDNNHGTHTMGTMTGDDGLGNQIGVAPGAKWIGCRNMERGYGTLTTYNECFEWFLAPYAYEDEPADGDPTKMPHVIANSWGCPATEGCNVTNFSIMEMALNNLRAAGCVIVVSAGNSGSSCGSVNTPAAFFNGSFSVGATDSNDNIAGFSSRGPVTTDGSYRLKPEISAPGVGVRSSVKNGGYASNSGTSMAGPHVAGVVALMISANPNLAGEVDKLEEIIEQTALTRTSTQNCGSVLGSSIPNNTFGYGRIDAQAAVNRAKNELFVPIIKIDQFGYRPQDAKIAILSDPQTGYNAADSYTPGSTIVVKNSNTFEIVYSGSPVAWNGGATNDQSGDKVWRFDFSEFTTPGTYHIADGSNGQIRSEDFEIREDIYNEIIRTVFKSFYYQRCGTAKTAPHVHEGFEDGICHSQDINARYINDEFNTSLYKNMSGGWHDAGDYNKYINFAYKPVNDLLFAYEINPQAWASDDLGIPESGNGIPDLLDEVKYELDWFMKMQDNDGGIYCVLGVKNHSSASPPSADGAIRYYGPKTTSASYTAAAAFAFAALQFRKIGVSAAQNYATLLENSALKAYNWAITHPGVTYYNSGIVAAGEQEVGTYDVNMRQLIAAIYLYSLTGSSTYKNYVESNYASSHLLQWGFVYPFENVTQISLLYYSSLNGVNTSVSTAIKNAYRNSMDYYTDNFPAYQNDLGAYLAYVAANNITWGSNETQSNMGNLFQAYHHFNLNSSNNEWAEEIMTHFVHYIHGVNPIGLAYITNMSDYGASRSANTIYHAWFTDGSNLWDDVRTSVYGPAPGFIPGGPNPSWHLDWCCPDNCGSSEFNELCVDLTPPSNQPTLKSYREWNTSWPQNSWEVTEIGIYVQSAYLLLLSSSVNTAIVPHEEDKLLEIANADVFINNNSSGLILTSPNGSKYKVNVSNAGLINTNLISSVPGGSSGLDNTSLYISENEKGVIVKSPNNNEWRLYVDKSGAFRSTLITEPLEFKLEQSSGDLHIEQNGRGLILKDEQGFCYFIEVSDTGSLFSKPVQCFD
ncbi:MAG TPA: hypothetical protein DCX89_04350, partial [Saprospirales bacterium]|nr:hypothetical protein [Saprospirales bacterium]